MEAPLVTIKQGQLKGKINRNSSGCSYYSFLGVPYGKAPIGELRFKPPLPAEKWQGTRDATTEGPYCPSSVMLLPLFTTGSENNCLNLNIYTPQLPNVTNFSLKPVMVWIHGGAFVTGSNTKSIYNPEYLITENIVLVCINYRLGVLGFLALRDSSLGVTGNAGLKDMVLALKWVQENIACFGGDPNNVTIFGESAGGAAVHYLCLSPLSKGLFHKAIAQSGCALNGWARGCHNSSFIAKHLGLSETEEEKLLIHLNSLSAKEIVKTQNKTEWFDLNHVRPFGPVVEPKNVEGAFLTEEPIEIIRAGTFNQVPLIIGYTSREGLVFKFLKSLISKSKAINFENQIFYDWNLKRGSKQSQYIAKELEKYYNSSDSEALIKTDVFFLYGIHNTVSNQKLVSQAPIYFYKISADTRLNKAKRCCTTKFLVVWFALYWLATLVGDNFIRNLLLKLAELLPRRPFIGCCHTDDLFYLFKTFVNEKLQPGSIEEVSVRRFTKLWTNFAKEGNPTPRRDDPLLEVQWKPVSKNTNFLLNIGNHLEMEIDPDRERIEFWNGLRPKEFISL